LHTTSTALPTDDTVHDPPSIGAFGKRVSPSSKLTSLTATPSASAAIWLIAV
jgi:hypothetical protein